MNKQDLIDKIAKEAEISKKAAGVTVDTMLSGIKGAVKKEGVITLVGFGTWKKMKRKARKGVNPATGEKIKIPAKTVVKFKASSAWKL